MILYNNIVKISKNRWIGYMLKVAFLLASSIHVYYHSSNSNKFINIYLRSQVSVYRTIGPVVTALLDKAICLCKFIQFRPLYKISFRVVNMTGLKKKKNITFFYCKT